VNPGERPDPARWKVLLALFCGVISLMLWSNGLIESLNRPSVANDLERRQLELAVLASPELPPALGQAFAGQDPLGRLQKHLDDLGRSQAEDGQPVSNDLLLEQALVAVHQGQRQRALPLLVQARDRDSAVATALLLDQPLAPAEAQRLSASLAPVPLLRHWSCEALSGNPQACGQPQVGQRSAQRLVLVNLLPGLTLLAGLGLLVRELWLRWRGRALPLSPLMGPALAEIDAVLLVGGGFVVVGELLTPWLLGPLVESLLSLVELPAALHSALSVLLLYLALMAGPLLILWWMLRGLGPAPQGGWLQFGWLPPWLPAGLALKGFLIVLPLVSLVSWLQSQLWSDPGGSNPLLELVLQGGSLAPLSCYAFTAIVLAPLFEETIFRGVLLPVVARQRGPWLGVLVSGLVFAIAHLSLGELPALLMLGLGLGWLRLSSGRLGASVLMHSLWNAMTFANLVWLGS